MIKPQMTVQELKAYLAENSATTGFDKPRKASTANYLAEMKLLLKSESIAFEEEYKFHPTRKWRFDIAFPEIKVAVEYEGIMSAKSRHTSIVGFSEDTKKYNAAAGLGWTVLRYTPLTKGNMLNDLKKYLG